MRPGSASALGLQLCKWARCFYPAGGFPESDSCGAHTPTRPFGGHACSKKEPFGAFCVCMNGCLRMWCVCVCAERRALSACMLKITAYLSNMCLFCMRSGLFRVHSLLDTERHSLQRQQTDIVKHALLVHTYCNTQSIRSRSRYMMNKHCSMVSSLDRVTSNVQQYTRDDLPRLYDKWVCV